jgi:hypothetical protein
LSVQPVFVSPEAIGWPVLGSATVALPALVAAPAGKNHDSAVTTNTKADPSAPTRAAKHKKRRFARLLMIIDPPEERRRAALAAAMRPSRERCCVE